MLSNLPYADGSLLFSSRCLFSALPAYSLGYLWGCCLILWLFFSYSDDSSPVKWISPILQADSSLWWLFPGLWRIMFISCHPILHTDFLSSGGSLWKTLPCLYLEAHSLGVPLEVSAVQEIWISSTLGLSSRRMRSRGLVHTSVCGYPGWLAPLLSNVVLEPLLLRIRWL